MAYALEIEGCSLCEQGKRRWELGPKFDNARDAARELERHRQWIAEYDERKRREADG